MRVANRIFWCQRSSQNGWDTILTIQWYEYTTTKKQSLMTFVTKIAVRQEVMQTSWCHSEKQLLTKYLVAFVCFFVCSTTSGMALNRFRYVWVFVNACMTDALLMPSRLNLFSRKNCKFSIRGVRLPLQGYSWWRGALYCFFLFTVPKQSFR